MGWWKPTYLARKRIQDEVETKKELANLEKALLIGLVIYLSLLSHGLQRFGAWSTVGRWQCEYFEERLPQQGLG